jgi:uncharacterized protein
MYERIFQAVKSVSFVLVAFSAVVCAYQYAVSVRNDYPGKTFSVDASGEIDTTPDVATFSVSVTTEGGNDVAGIQQSNTDKMNQVDAFLKEQGIDARDIKTSQYSISPRYEYPPCGKVSCSAPKISGYSISQTFDIKVRDIAKLGALLSGVVENGGNTVSEVKFVVDDSDAARDVARKEAIRKAQEKAESIAQSAGFRLGKLVSVYEDTAADTSNTGDARDGLMSAKLSTPVIEPGTQETQVQMTLTYEIHD